MLTALPFSTWKSTSVPGASEVRPPCRAPRANSYRWPSSPLIRPEPATSLKARTLPRMSLRSLQGSADDVRATDAVAGDAILDLAPEMTEQALHRPGGRVGKTADRVALHVGGDIEQQIDLVGLGVAVGHPLHDPPHPAGAFAARRA